MQLNFEVLKRVSYLTGSAETAAQLPEIPAKQPFDESILDFLNDVSRELMGNRTAKAYSDLVTLGFWLRKGSLKKLQERFETRDGFFHLGKGVAFHVAPSNVPINFAYSLAAGLLMGNANAVRVPSKNFDQVRILTEILNHVLEKHPEMVPYVLCMRYGRDKEINDLFSSIADIRVIWGGNQTIEELRQSPLPPRSGEITFADRYSMAVIDADSYLALESKTRIAEDFYNDTFFSDQNACTSPRMIVWTGEQIQEAKRIFWEEEHRIAEKKYNLQPVQGINKLVKSCLIAAVEPGVKVAEHQDNLIIRVAVPRITASLMDYRENSGYFYEYDCKDILDLVPLCNDKRCQTIAYIGEKNVIKPLLETGVKGIDRVVPMGKTMDFDLIWDGYNLPALLSRTVVLN